MSISPSRGTLAPTWSPSRGSDLSGGCWLRCALVGRAVSALSPGRPAISERDREVVEGARNLPGCDPGGQRTT